MPDRPEIVCICGSTRFVDEMRAANRDLTFAGAIVVAPGVFLRAEPTDASVLDGRDDQKRVELIAERLRHWKAMKS